MNYSEETFLIHEQIELVDILQKLDQRSSVDEIKEGLLAPQKFISPKFFYDEVGSRLFEEITQLKEYYPTVTEKNIISSLYPKLNLGFEDFNIIELGSGDHTKISLFLNQIPKHALSEITYHPVDISKSAIKRAASHLNLQFPNLSISGIVADFIHQLPQLSFNGKNLFLFMGSTIGNLSFNERKTFMEHLSSIMKPGDYLLLGMDLVKDINILENAYNDENNITARFNKNILRAVNRMMGSCLNPDDFTHHAFYNKNKSRIEMHLIASRDMSIDFPVVNRQIVFRKDETIHTENSHKFTNESIEEIGGFGALKLMKNYTDKNQWFSVSLFRK